MTIPLHYEAKKAGLTESVQVLVETFGADEVLAASLVAGRRDGAWPLPVLVLDVLRAARVHDRGARLTAEDVASHVGVDTDRVARALRSLNVVDLVQWAQADTGPSDDKFWITAGGP